MSAETSKPGRKGQSSGHEFKSREIKCGNLGLTRRGRSTIKDRPNDFKGFKLVNFPDCGNDFVFLAY